MAMWSTMWACCGATTTSQPRHFFQSTRSARTCSRNLAIWPSQTSRAWTKWALQFSSTHYIACRNRFDEVLRINRCPRHDSLRELAFLAATWDGSQAITDSLINTPESGHQARKHDHLRVRLDRNHSARHVTSRPSTNMFHNSGECV